MIAMRNSKAFTMFEILLVMGLIGILFAFIAPKIIRYIGKSEEAQVKLKIMGIKEALNEYRVEFGTYPSTRDGLRALLENVHPNEERFKRAANKWPMAGLKEEDIVADASGTEFIYHCPVEEERGRFKHFEIIYPGKTGAPDDKDRISEGL